VSGKSLPTREYGGSDQRLDVGPAAGSAARASSCCQFSRTVKGGSASLVRIVFTVKAPV